VNNECLLYNFREKPVHKFEVSMGIYMLNKKVLEFIPENIAFGFDQLMLTMLKEKKNVMIKKHLGYWLDIGRPDDYEQATNDYNKIIKKFI
jgi:NDP-sugar pyrophosphorylase family protein